MNIIQCDFLIIGAGIAGINLAANLNGKSIIIDKSPFKYKPGESHLPNFVYYNSVINNLQEKLAHMKSFCPKLGSAFLNKENEAASFDIFPLEKAFAFHARRQELELLLAEETQVDIRSETFEDIDFDNNVVYTNKATYHVKQKIFDCSGGAMLVANKLGTVQTITRLGDVSAYWGYWNIEEFDEQSFSHIKNLTVLTRINRYQWFWMIPLYGGTQYSIGLISRGEKKLTIEDYQLIIGMEIKKYFKSYHYTQEFYTHSNFSKFSNKVVHKNTILVGDAYCFSDPVFSTGTCLAMAESSFLAKEINLGRFDIQEYETKTKNVLKHLLDGIQLWYSGTYNTGENRKFIAQQLLPGKILDAQYGEFDSTIRTVHKIENVFSNNEIFY